MINCEKCGKEFQNTEVENIIKEKLCIKKICSECILKMYKELKKEFDFDNDAITGVIVQSIITE